MSLTATIISVSSDPHYGDDPMHAQFEFSLIDGEDQGMISLLSSVTLAHATFLASHVISNDLPNAYEQMVYAIASTEEVFSLIGRRYTSED